jgi:hypothetical protein
MRVIKTHVSHHNDVQFKNALKMTYSKMPISIMTLRITTLSITILNTRILNITTVNVKEIQHNDDCRIFGALQSVVMVNVVAP